MFMKGARCQRSSAAALPPSAAASQGLLFCPQGIVIANMQVWHACKCDMHASVTCMRV